MAQSKNAQKGHGRSNYESPKKLDNVSKKGSAIKKVSSKKSGGKRGDR